jgi:small-conductance mechanosensitive channel
MAGLSWLIGGSLAEVLTSIIFLFIKHPYDVGDRIKVEKDIYTVKEIRLLSTIFLAGDNALVQAPNVVLNSQFIINFRRSPEMSEPFTFDVGYETSFEQIEALRGRMVAFLSNERRDYVAVFDVIVMGKERRLSVGSQGLTKFHRYPRSGEDVSQGRYQVQEQRSTRFIEGSVGLYSILRSL